MVTKINVSFPKEVLEELDKAARKARSSRSAFLVQAVKRFLEEKEEEQALKRRKRAAEGIDRIREKLGAWDATGEVLKWRELH